MKFKVNDQVLLRENVRGVTGGRTNAVVRVGKILSFRGEDKAEVALSQNGSSFQGAPGRMTDIRATRRVVSVDKLEPVDARFGGRKVVQANPIHRSIGSLIRN